MSDESGKMSDAGLAAAGRQLRLVGTRGCGPRQNMMVMMSVEGRAICQAHGFSCPEGQADTGKITKVMEGQVEVSWEIGTNGAYLCGKFDKYMLVCADPPDMNSQVGGGGDAVEPAGVVGSGGSDGRDVAHHEDWGRRAWWKGNIKVRVCNSIPESATGTSALGRLVKVVVMVDGEPNEITVPSRCIIPPEPAYKLEPSSRGMGGESSNHDGVRVLSVKPWWDYATSVRITDTNSRLDGRSALVVALEVQVEIQNTLRAPQRVPLANVSLDTYILGSQLVEDGKYTEAETMLQSALADADLHQQPLQQVKVLLHLFALYMALSNFGNALTHVLKAQAIIQHPLQQPQHAAQGEAAQLHMQVLGNLGQTHSIMGDAVKARFYLMCSLALARKMRATADEGKCLASLGDLSVEEGDYKTAIVWFDSALKVSLKQVDHEEIAVNHTLLALAKCHLLRRPPLGVSHVVDEDDGGDEESLQEDARIQKLNTEMKWHLKEAETWARQLNDQVLDTHLASIRADFQTDRPISSADGGGGVGNGVLGEGGGGGGGGKGVGGGGGGGDTVKEGKKRRKRGF